MTAVGVPRVRHARPADLPRIALLAAEHAAYENAAQPPADLPQRLEALLFGSAAGRLRCFVAELDDGDIIVAWDVERFVPLCRSRLPTSFQASSDPLFEPGPAVRPFR
ncbi:hypothetical protein ALI22I_08010 [Saccharothrix sp. ALI-22-I]|uniref:hypothetical protein n=1 Tax=Saccharothrix sp. ALI-22-I TaxID=1933778 RepID=UPI00097C37C5|nr:hypothetical protein [Saccharothrix sp. ALI-22-I]ONI91562.1 hypothetical protein ALI22I_08010 [Saccharothrix sp. ALI-22-I]